MRHIISDQAARLEGLRIRDIEQWLTPYKAMPTEARAAAEAHNAAIDLLQGRGAYESAWEPLPIDVAGALQSYDPGPAAPLTDNIVGLLQCASTPFNHPDPDTVKAWLLQLSAIDRAHPLVVHRDVLRVRCYPFVASPPVW